MAPVGDGDGPQQTGLPVRILTSAVDSTVAVATHTGDWVSIHGIHGKLSFSTQISQILLLSPSHLLVFALSGEILLIEVASGKQLAHYYIPNRVGVHAVAVGDGKAIVGTSDGSVYILSVTGTVMSHQLMIASNATTLGALVAVATGPRLLAILGTRAVLVLDTEIVDKPKLVFKMALASSPTTTTQIVWCEAGLVLMSGESMTLIRSNAAAGTFEQVPVRSTINGYRLYLVSGCVFLIEKTRQIFMAELILTSGGYVMQVLPVPHTLPDSFPLATSIVCAGKYSVSIRGKGTTSPLLSIDMHQIQATKWIEIVHSLIHSQKFEDAFALLAGLQAGTVPRLLDRPTSGLLADPEFLEMCASKYVRQTEKYNQHTLGVFCANFSLFPIFERLLDSTGDTRWPLWVMEMVLTGVIPARKLTRDLVKRVIESGELEAKKSDSAKARVDLFISIVVLSCGPVDVLIDPNQTVRLATGLDLKFSTILIHLFLLNEAVLPVQYLVAASEWDDAFYYMFALSSGLGYPCWEGRVASLTDHFSDILVDEPQLIKKLATHDEKLLLNSIGFNLRIFDSMTAKLGDGAVVSDERLLYGIKASLIENRLPELWLKHDKNKCINLLISRGETPLVLKLFDYVQEADVCKPDIVQVITTLLSSSSAEGILAFVDKFSSTLSMAEVVDIFMAARRPDLTVLLSAQRRDFTHAVKVLNGMVEDATVATDTVVGLARELMEKYGSFITEEAAVSLWAQILSSRRTGLKDVDSAIRTVGRHVNVLKLVASLTNVPMQSALLSLVHDDQALLSHAAAISAVDVGKQFAVLAKQDSGRTRGVAVTASICHECLDPISQGTGRVSDLMLFSCGHIVHSSCADGVGKACPVCI